MRATFLLGVALLCALSSPAAAQEDCETQGVDVHSAGPGAPLFIRPARLYCRDGNLTVRADSAYLYEEARTYHLFGNVFIDNPEVTLQGRAAQYYAAQQMIMAQGSVRLRRKADGTSIEGGENLEFLQAGASRPEEQLTVSGGRPRAVLLPRAPAGADAGERTPYQVEADRIVVRGQDSFEAQGRVEIERGELRAAADDVLYLSSAGQLRLLRQARLETGAQTMRGGVILVSMPEEEISDVTAWEDAELVGERFQMEAPLLQIFLAGGEVERLIAGRSGQSPFAPAAPPAGTSGAARPLALADDFTIQGDSLEFEFSGESPRSVLAIGRARVLSTATPDSLETAHLPEVAQRDWIEGDTIVAFFSGEPEEEAGAAAPADTLQAGEREGPRLESLVARIDARALLRMPAADTTSAGAPGGARPAAVHYVAGETISLTLQDGTVQTVEVEGQVAGLHLEPRAGQMPAPAPAQPGADEPAPVPPPAGTPPP